MAMIIYFRPSALGLRFTLRGSVIPMIALCIVVAVISAAVTLAHPIRPMARLRIQDRMPQRGPGHRRRRRSV